MLSSPHHANNLVQPRHVPRQLKISVTATILLIAEETLAFTLRLLYSFQVDLNMKGATFQWQRCSDLPIKHAYNAQAVLLEKKVYFQSVIEVETVPPYMYTYDIDDNLWQLFPSPARRAALAVYRGKVVLAGGMLSNDTVTNKVWVLQDDNTWSESLPPMPTARYAASATSGNNFLIVAAGMTNGSCASDMVEIYDGKQWMAMSPLPRKWWNSWSTSLNGYCFLFCQCTSVLYTSIQDDATKGSIKQLGWKKLPDTPCSTTGITTFAGTLLAVGTSIHMYYPLAQQWVSLRNDLMPVKYYEYVVSLSSRELMVIGKENRENCLQVYKGTLVSK